MLQVFQGPDATTESKLKGRNEVLYMFCVFHKGRGFLFLAFISGIISLLPLCREFNFYHLQHTVPFASFKENEQNISPYEKEICHLFYYFKVFIARRDAVK